ncbi:MAG TPA: hypothetical protein VLA34_08395 [Candidatus Krumholzibacterium sp.]|nr:hypothetical protein [Candidatus Krumholzibacterium sp.]
MATRVIEDGTYYTLEVGESEWGEWVGKMVFLLRNKEFNVIEAEGPNEIQARVYFDYYENQKAEFIRDGLPSTTAPQGPEVH